MLKPDRPPKYIMNLSGGASSAIAWFRALDAYGPDAVTAHFADTNSEHPDTYRFLDDCQTHAGQPITRLHNNGETIWDVFRATGFWSGNNRGCIASYKLKKQALTRAAETIASPETTTILLGLQWTEDDRIRRTTAALHPWKTDYPLTWSPRLQPCDVIDHLKKRGIDPPIMYDDYLAYPHNNCHGCCILAGISQWAGVYKDFPHKFAEAEAHEQHVLAYQTDHGRPQITILRDRRGGDTKNYALTQLREDIQNGVRLPRSDWRTPCTCMFTP